MMRKRERNEKSKEREKEGNKSIWRVSEELQNGKKREKKNGVE